MISPTAPAAFSRLASICWALSIVFDRSKMSSAKSASVTFSAGYLLLLAGVIVKPGFALSVTKDLGHDVVNDYDEQITG